MKMTSVPGPKHSVTPNVRCPGYIGFRVKRYRPRVIIRSSGMTLPGPRTQPIAPDAQAPQVSPLKLRQAPWCETSRALVKSKFEDDQDQRAQDPAFI